MSLATELTTRCSRAGGQALRQGRELAAGPIGAYHAGTVLLRGAPHLAGWLAGWASAELPLLTGHALCRANTPVSGVATRWAAQHADRILADALQESFGVNYRDQVSHPIVDQPDREGSVRLWHAAGQRRRYAATTSNIRYGPGGRNHLLDIWRRPDLTPGSRAPVLVQVPGGAWSINDKRGQGYPLMSRMAELGWICVSINYSRSPSKAWPAHIVDVKRAIAWLRDHIADYGGDPDFITITGGSAGGHLAALAALTTADARLQPGFEEADTRVQAAVPFYGVYDFTAVEKMHELMLPFLEHFVMKTRYADDPGLFESASPIAHAHDAAPPFFVLHGENDPLVPSAQARTFCATLRAAGAADVAYAELPNAHHAFDTMGTVRTQITVDAVAAFLGIVYGRHAFAGLAAPRAASPAS